MHLIGYENIKTLLPVNISRDYFFNKSGGTDIRTTPQGKGGDTYKVLDNSYKVQSPKSFSLKDLKVPTHLFCFSQ